MFVTETRTDFSGDPRSLRRKRNAPEELLWLRCLFFFLSFLNIPFQVHPAHLKALNLTFLPMSCCHRGKVTKCVTYLRGRVKRKSGIPDVGKCRSNRVIFSLFETSVEETDHSKLVRLNKVRLCPNQALTAELFVGLFRSKISDVHPFVVVLVHSLHMLVFNHFVGKFY